MRFICDIKSELPVELLICVLLSIADSGGLNAAFAAWKRSEAKDPGQLLPGLQNFTKEQIFFM